MRISAFVFLREGFDGEYVVGVLNFIVEMLYDVNRMGLGPNIRYGLTFGSRARLASLAYGGLKCPSSPLFTASNFVESVFSVFHTQYSNIALKLHFVPIIPSFHLAYKNLWLQKAI